MPSTPIGGDSRGSSSCGRGESTSRYPMARAGACERSCCSMGMRGRCVAIRGDSWRVPVGVSAPVVRCVERTFFALCERLAFRLPDVPFARFSACQFIRHSLSQKTFRTVLLSGSPLPHARHFLSMAHRTTVRPRNTIVRCAGAPCTDACSDPQTQRHPFVDHHAVA